MGMMTAEVGTRVRLERPGMFFSYATVVALVPVELVAFTESGRTMVPASNEYRLRFDDGTEFVTDLRQNCWTVAA